MGGAYDTKKETVEPFHAQANAQGTAAPMTKFPSSYVREAASQPKIDKTPFLKPEQRARLESIFLARVVDAHGSYMSALTKLQVEKLIEKKEDLPMWQTLVMQAGMMVLERAIMFGVAAVKVAGAAIKQLKKVEIHVEKEGEVEGKFLGLEESQVETLVGVGVDKVKEKAIDVAGEAHGEGAEEDRAASTDYITYLKDSSMMVFQHVREDRLATASDAELTALCAAFDGSRHTETIYYNRLKEQVERFLRSHAKEIGHRFENKTEKVEGGKQTSKVRKETRVAWLVTGRSDRQLIYVSKDFHADTKHDIGAVGGAYNEVRPPGDAYTTNENALGLDEKGTWHDKQKGKDFVGAKEDVEMENLGPVESDLKDVALAAHNKRWLQAPQTVTQGPYGLVVVK